MRSSKHLNMVSIDQKKINRLNNKVSKFGSIGRGSTIYWQGVIAKAVIFNTNIFIVFNKRFITFLFSVIDRIYC